MVFQAYDFEETEVGCAAHNDPSCLCDVVVNNPVEVTHGLGDCDIAVLFSVEANKDMCVKDDFVTHVGIMLAIYDAAAKGIRKADETIRLVDSVEYNPLARRVSFTEADEVWLRKDIPHTWAAAALGLERAEPVIEWRKKHGVTITKRPSDFQSTEWRFSRRGPKKIKPTPPPPRPLSLNVDDPAVLEALRDTNNTSVELGRRWGVSHTTVWRTRKRLGIEQPEPKNARETFIARKVDWKHPDTIAILDGNLSERDAAYHLGCSHSSVRRHRMKRDRATMQRNESGTR